MKKHKMLQLSLALVLVMSLFLTACTKKEVATVVSATPAASMAAVETTAPSAEPAPTAPAQFTLGSEPLSFSFYGNYDWWVTNQWGGDSPSKWIQDNLKVTVTPIQSGGAAVQKLSTMIAVNELPDVILLDRGPDVEKLVKADKLVALDPYLDKYPNLKKYAGESTLNMLRSEDGKLYTFPNYYTQKPNGNAGYVINTKIYKALGSPKLETFEELASYLKMVKAKYPKIVPLEVDVNAGGVYLFATGFEENYPITFINEKAVPRDDKLTSLFLDPTFNTTLKYASQLFRDKLITQDAFTQKSDQVYEKLKNGRVAVFVSGDALNSKVLEAHNFLKQKDPEDGYMAIWPIHKDGVSKDKVFPNSFASQGWNVNVITKGAKNPEAIFAYLDWLTGNEGQTVTNFGPKGQYWDTLDADGAPIPNAKWTSTPQADKDKEHFGSFDWAGNTAFLDGTKAKIDSALPEDQRSWSTTQQLNVMWKTSLNTTEFTNLAPSPDSPEGIAATALQDIITKATAKAIYAKNDAEVDSILKEANDSAVSQGYDKLLLFKTTKWLENVAKVKVQ
ncbi:extracellular solute-binding protein [Paenibacillus psychroresistens]|uniref:Extracellular solute-binding protein n=1 Tax=Paenibacillus psychroresistens TaxID=1778678 RepID=A0A6B8RII0_9BACL|nr:extracellular solute-binding protein [Paenibacillus psychroresistens]QGQ95186.1 extracellular solute-binding protein [Paenibacillus psychroresistens]